MKGNISTLNIELLSKLKSDLVILKLLVATPPSSLPKNKAETSWLNKSLLLGAYSIMLSALNKLNYAFTEYYNLEKAGKYNNLLNFIIKPSINEKLTLHWNYFIKYKSLRDKIAHDGYLSIKKSHNSNDLFCLIKQSSSIKIIKDDYFEEIVLEDCEILDEIIDSYLHLMVILIDNVNEFKNQS